MANISQILQVIGLILVVVMCFNIIIFVHELGHFLAAKWRGLQVEKFQIWFGRPIWKKTIGGVQYGLGWIPAGGFVALPQMAPMEALEGGSSHDKPLPAVTPLDKIIVAFAGPLFSMLLALLAAVVVWGVGKPADFIPTQIVGEVAENSPAARAGMLPGDKITHINGKQIHGFAGSLDSISESVVLSKGQNIEFTIERNGSPAPLKIPSTFELGKTKWYQRGGLRRVGISPEMTSIQIGSIVKGSPAHKAGFLEGDTLISLNGQKFKSDLKVIAFIKETGTKPIEAEILRKGVLKKLVATPQVPTSPAGKNAMLGLSFYGVPYQTEGLIYPNPLHQIFDKLKMMWTTVASVIAPDSSIGVQHLSGPVGIGSVMFEFLQMENGWRQILAFMVLFNVNLAVLNMMPLPVLDGGHITLAILEKIAGRPVARKPLEIIQTACALALISLMIFVTSKDVGDKFGHGPAKSEEIIFPAN